MENFEIEKKIAELYSKQESTNKYHSFKLHLEDQLKNISFTDKKVLEIGGGRGFVSLYISIIKKAPLVVSVDESQGEGHEVNIIDKLSENMAQLGVNNIKIVKQNILDFNTDEKFDIIISNNAMHHVCEHGLLKYDVRARKKYIKIFEHLKSLLNDDGKLMLWEYSRNSLWRIFKIKRFQNVEWSLHPTKAEWISVIKKANFKNISVEYSIPNFLRPLKFLFRFGIFQFFIYPSFYLRAKK